jgi:hypothetical protein
MAVWFRQRIGLQNRWIGFMKGDGSGLGAFFRKVATWCEDRHLRLGKNVLPHDADAEILGESITTKRRILEARGHEERRGRAARCRQEHRDRPGAHRAAR